MNILILNLMVYTTQVGRTSIVRKKTIKDTMIYNFIRGFIANGHTVTLSAGEPFRPEQAEEYECQVEWFPLGYQGVLPNGLMYPKGLWSYLKKNKDQFDLIISSDVFSFCSLIAAMICPEKLLIWHEPGKFHDKFHQLPAKFWYQVITRLFIKKNVAVIARSEKARNFISPFVDHLSPEYIDHGINQEIFQFSDRKEKFFLVIAQLILRKRVDIILQKFSRFVKKYGTEYHLYIAGDGPERENLTKLAEELGIASSVTFLGFQTQPELVQRLCHASGVLMDSLHEFSMVSIPESVVCGTPVLTNSVPYPAAYVASDRLGITKDDWNEDDIQSLLEHQKEFVENCRKRRPKMSNQYLAKRMLELYTDLKK